MDDMNSANSCCEKGLTAIITKAQKEDHRSMRQRLFRYRCVLRIHKDLYVLVLATIFWYNNICRIYIGGDNHVEAN